MQLCALDSNDKLIYAAQAVKQHDYFCLECRQKVRKRSGIHRQAHFYHLQPNQACRLHAKGMVHLMVQNTLKEILPEGEVQLEYRFDGIGRIADVAWLPRRLIFEVQCSPITAEEVAARNAAYASAGFQVVWILHDARYNQKRLSAAEDVLRLHPHYFTNMDEAGQGMIYDHFSLIDKGMRTHRLPRMAIDPASPREKFNGVLFEGHPRALRERAEAWHMGFVGDCLSRCLLNEEALVELLKGIFEQEVKVDEIDFLSTGLWEALQRGWGRFILAPYRAIFRLLLERACR